MLSALIGAFAAKSAISALPAEPSLLLQMRDAVLYQGEFGSIMFYVCLTGFVCANLRLILQQKPDIRFAHGFVLCVLLCYGGSTLAAIVCGNPVVFVTNEALVPTVAFTWAVVYMMPGLFLAFARDTNVGSIFISTAFEIMRCHVGINCARMANATLKAGAYPVPVIGPLVAVLLGACGGGFFPLDKGLKPLEAEFNWRIASTTLNAVFLQLALFDPYAKPIIAAYLPPLADPDWVRFASICLLALPPLGYALVPGYSPLGSNPLVGAKPVAVPAEKKAQ